MEEGNGYWFSKSIKLFELCLKIKLASGIICFLVNNTQLEPISDFEIGNLTTGAARVQLFDQH